MRVALIFHLNLYEGIQHSKISFNSAVKQV